MGCCVGHVNFGGIFSGKQGYRMDENSLFTPKDPSLYLEKIGKIQTILRWMTGMFFSEIRTFLFDIKN